MSTCSPCDAPVGELTDSDLEAYFAGAAYARDECAWLEPAVQLMGEFTVAVAWIAQSNGQVVLVQVCGEGSIRDVDVDTMTRSVIDGPAGRSGAVGTQPAPSGSGRIFAVAIANDGRSGYLCLHVTDGVGSDETVDSRDGVLAAIGAAAWRAHDSESRVLELQTRAAHLEAEQDTLKASHSNAITNVIQEREDRVREHEERMIEQRETRDITVFALAKLAESRDPETGAHLERIRAYSSILARTVQDLRHFGDEIDDEFLDSLFQASPLHDIGKVGIPDVILLYPGRLSTREFEIMKRHTTIGAEALDEAARRSRSGGFLKMAAEVARSHHERVDGGGYPEGLSRADIPLAARIVALADVYDALTSIRVYKSAFEPEVARKMIEQESGKQFDPAIVEAFLLAYDGFLDVQRDPDAAEPGTRKIDDIRR